ncbi:MAG: hypothetical protein ACTSU5_22375 [Promethearchaeota archaeon]
MAKKTGRGTKTRSRSTGNRHGYRHLKAIRVLGALGAILSLYYHVVLIALQFTSFRVLPYFNPLGSYGVIVVLVAQVIAIILNFLLLATVGAFSSNFKVHLSWYVLLALGIADAILGGSLGALVILIAAVIAIFDRM